MTKPSTPFDRADPPRRLYGRRHGKPLRAGRKALVENVLPNLLVDIPEQNGTLDPKTLFPNKPRQVWLEVGFGKGEHLLWQATNHTDVGCIGVEPFVNGLASLIDEIDRDDISNIRLYDDDAALLLEGLQPGSLSRIFVLFPDPWPKSRHHKRRFIRPENIDLISAALAEGGELRIGTDHADYGNWIIRHMHQRADFEWMAQSPADWRTRPEDWPQTRYEAKGLREGRPSIYLRYRRLASAV
jgi:tRNA (guanine-N7-)-methyltransferase